MYQSHKWIKMSSPRLLVFLLWVQTDRSLAFAAPLVNMKTHQTLKVTRWQKWSNIEMWAEFLPPKIPFSFNQFQLHFLECDPCFSWLTLRTLLSPFFTVYCFILQLFFLSFLFQRDVRTGNQTEIKPHFLPGALVHLQSRFQQRGRFLNKSFEMWEWLKKKNRGCLFFIFTFWLSVRSECKKSWRNTILFQVIPTFNNKNKHFSFAVHFCRPFSTIQICF